MIIFAAVIGTFQFRVVMGNACLIITLMLVFFWGVFFLFFLT